MRVINARHDELGRLLLLVDQIPTLETLRFRKLRVDNPRDPGHLYVAEHDGYVQFFFQHDPDHAWYGQGFAGRKFHLYLEDGTHETLVGPWSSSADQVNRCLPELAAREVALTDDARRFQAGGTAVAGAITTRLWAELSGRLLSRSR